MGGHHAREADHSGPGREAEPRSAALHRRNDQRPDPQNRDLLRPFRPAKCRAGKNRPALRYLRAPVLAVLALLCFPAGLPGWLAGLLYRMDDGVLHRHPLCQTTRRPVKRKRKPVNPPPSRPDVSIVIIT